MALSASLVWEVRTTGNAANGGSFRAGSTGTDYSQQDSAQITYSDLACTGTSATSSLNPFSSVHVGNVINISSSTGGWTAGYYEIISVSGVTATLDRSPAATGTSGIGSLGGATNSPSTIASVAVGSNVVWIKSGTYNVDSPYFTASITPTPTAPRGRISGYGTVRGDSGRATLKYVGAGGGITSCLRTTNGWDVIQLDANGSSIAANGFFMNQRCSVLRCTASACSNYGINISTLNTVQGCEVTGTANVAGISGGNYAMILGNHIHDNTCTGIITSTSNTISNNIIVNNTGASSDGIQVSNSCNVIGNTVFGNGRHGLNQTGNENNCNIVQGNIFAGNGGYGAVFASVAGNRATQLNDGNAYYNNTSGTRTNGSDTTVNSQNGIGPYINILDRLLTSNPFVNSANKDFSLNRLSGGGALCIMTGYPSLFPGSSLVSYGDIGSLQSRKIIKSVGTNGGYNS